MADFCRAAALRWISPFRAARSSRRTAASRTSSFASADFAFLRAVRSSERCARLRMAAARDLRRFFLADAILGTKRSPDLGRKFPRARGGASRGTYSPRVTDVKAGL